TAEAPRVFAWAENPGYTRGDSRWPAPVHLTTDGADDYTYRLTSAGFVLGRRMNEAGEGADRVVTIFNPRRHRIEQRAGGKTLTVYFRGGSSGAGGVERIE